MSKTLDIQSASPFKKKRIVDEFHQLIYEGAANSGSWAITKYFGITTWKLPSDMWLYQETIYEVKPKLIIETGTYLGGSALFFAHLLDQLGEGRVLSIDLERVRRELPRHPRITYLGGHSSAEEAIRWAAETWIEYCGPGPVMVVLDSEHSKDHVLAELDSLGLLTTPGSYLVVEDTNINGHPVFPEHGPGPQEALDEWLPEHPDFRIDQAKPDKFLFSFHTWLRRMRA